MTVFVPHYAMSGGTLLALTADEIVMDPHAVLGPVDPQIGDMAASSIVKLLALKPPAQISDEMLVLADVAQKARVQVATFVGAGTPEAHAEGPRGRLGDCPERGSVDARFSDHGRRRQRAGTPRIDGDAAAHLRIDGFVPAIRRGPTFGDVRAITSPAPGDASRDMPATK